MCEQGMSAELAAIPALPPLLARAVTGATARPDDRRCAHQRPALSRHTHHSLLHVRKASSQFSSSSSCLPCLASAASHGSPSAALRPPPYPPLPTKRKAKRLFNHPLLFRRSPGRSTRAPGMRSRPRLTSRPRWLCCERCTLEAPPRHSSSLPPFWRVTRHPEA